MNPHKLIKLGPCPVCDKIIAEKGRANEHYTTFFVEYTDGTIAEYAICKTCRPLLTKEQINEICENQIFTWGQEVLRQVVWYNSEAVFLKPLKWADNKSGL